MYTSSLKPKKNVEEEEEEEEKWSRGAAELWSWITSFVISYFRRTEFCYFCISIIFVFSINLLFLLFFYFQLVKPKPNDIRLNLYITIKLITFIRMK